MTNHDAMVPVEPGRLRQHCADVFAALGVPPEEAFLSADSLVTADLRGHPSHGVQRLTAYTNRIRRGAIDVRARGRVVQETDGSAVVDGENALGQVVSRLGMAVAIKKARGRGIAAVQARHSNHFGTAAYWAMMALPENMIGFATTNTTLVMPPFGGAARRIGNNPWSFAVPAADEVPLVLDMAQAFAAVGKVQVAQMKGERIPLTWATDRRGVATDDPRVVLEEQGMYLPIGAYKGFGQAMIVDVLCGLLGGRQWGDLRGLFTELDKPSGISHFFFAIDIACFTDPGAFRQLVDHMIRGIKDTPLAPGHSRIYSPGEPEHFHAARCAELGRVPVLRAALDEINALAGELGLAPLALS